jgi:beta-carotene 3-hydroxylase
VVWKPCTALTPGDALFKRACLWPGKAPIYLAMEWLAPAVIVFVSLAAMEGIAWASHKYVMHGFAWAWHRDHHQPHDKLLEKNDRFALVGAALSIAMFAVGSPLAMGARAWWPGTWIGLGVLGYGIVYTLVHDGLVHQRWFRWVPRRGYARRLVQAHNLHHATTSKEGGVSFGFVFARDPATLRAELRSQQAARVTTMREPAISIDRSASSR